MAVLPAGGGGVAGFGPANIDPSAGFITDPVNAPNANIQNLIAQILRMAHGNGGFVGHTPAIMEALQGAFNHGAGPLQAGNRGDGSTPSGGFMWGGQLWQPGSGGLFQKWLAAHGVNAQTWATMHPAAAKLLGIMAGRGLGSAGPSGGI